MTSLNTSKSILEFCTNNNISISTFYRHQDSMPRTVYIGKQRRILAEDETQWINNLRSSLHGERTI